jgi:hypothetical protein
MSRVVTGLGPFFLLCCASSREKKVRVKGYGKAPLSRYEVPIAGNQDLGASHLGERLLTLLRNGVPPKDKQLPFLFQT